MKIDDTDRALLDLLRKDCRNPTSVLARQLGLSRSTVKDRISRLERGGIIRGYQVKLDEAFEEGEITAHVMLDVNPKAINVVHALKKIPEIKTLCAVNGTHDLMATLRTSSTQSLDRALDAIGSVEGIDKTVSYIILSTKFDR